MGIRGMRMETEKWSCTVEGCEHAVDLTVQVGQAYKPIVEHLAEEHHIGEFETGVVSSGTLAE